MLASVTTLTTPPSYSFQEEGAIVVANDVAHIALEVDLRNLVEGIAQIPEIYEAVVIASNQANGTVRITLQGLASLIQTEYRDISSEIKNTVNFITGQDIKLPPLVSPKKQTRLVGNKIVRARKKRFVGFLLGAIASASLFSFYDASKLQAIHEELDDVEARERNLVTLVSKDSHDISINRLAITNLAKITGTLARAVEENGLVGELIVAKSFVENSLQTVRSGLQVVQRVLEGSSSGKLAFGTISFKGASKSLAKTNILAQKRGLIPLITTPQQLLQAPCSFIPQNYSLVIYVHVPIAKSASILSMYKYFPFPTKITDKIDMLYIPPKNNILALSSNPAQGNYFLELGHEDLALCKKIHSFHVCPHLQFLVKTTYPSCLVDLYFADHASAKTTCQLHLIPPRDTIIPLGHNRFLAYTLNPSTYSVLCPNNQTQHTGYQLAETQQITVPPTCIVRLPNFDLFAQNDLHLKLPPKTYHWTLAPRTMFPVIKPEYLEDALKTLQSIEHLPPTDLANIHTAFFVHHPWSPHKWPLYFTSGGVLLLLTVLTLLTASYCIAYRLKNPTRPVEAGRDVVS